MYKKIEITGKIEILTGLHIGGNDANSFIGGTDSPVITENGNPIIPGSSLKGKIRTLLSRVYNESIVEKEGDCSEIKKLFGSTDKDGKLSKVIFRDCKLINPNKK
jgi:CRISPR-associated protein Csm3